MTRGKTLAAVHGASSDHSEEGGGTLTIRSTKLLLNITNRFEF